MQTPGSSRQDGHRFETQIRKALGYLLYLPAGYGADPARRWPLLLSLHGSGQRGDDLELLKGQGMLKVIERSLEGGADLPFLVLSPQCPQDSWWPHETDALLALLDEVVATHAVDQRRIYLTGLSMGGYGALALAIKAPERFAALVPICGGINALDPRYPEQLERLKDLPTWLFHGVLDRIVPPLESERVFTMLQRYRGNVQLTIYSDLEHDAWTRTYDDPALYEWLLGQSRAEQRVESRE